MSADVVCPHCSASMRGEPIPAEQREHYGESTHFSRVVGHEVSGVYDGVLYWSCPDCGLAWERWCDGGRLTLAAVEHVQRHNAVVLAARGAAS